MRSKRRMGRARGQIVGFVIGIVVVCQALTGLAAPPASAVLLDFKDDAQLAQIRTSDQTKIEPSSKSYQGKRAAKLAVALRFPKVFATTRRR